MVNITLSSRITIDEQLNQRFHTAELSFNEKGFTPYNYLLL